MIDTSPWSSCSRRSPWSPWSPCSSHTFSSTGPSVSPFRNFSLRRGGNQKKFFCAYLMNKYFQSQGLDLVRYWSSGYTTHGISEYLTCTTALKFKIGGSLHPLLFIKHIIFLVKSTWYYQFHA